MLEEIISSKFDSAVLGFFLSTTNRSFSILEIAKRLQMPHFKTAHSLNRLVEAGYLRSFSKKNKKYFFVNPKNKQLPELVKYWQKEGPVLKDEMCAAIRKLGDVRAAFLSGVFCGYANLPVDILLVGKVNLKKLADFLKAGEKLMGQEINYSIMTEGEFQQRRNTFDRFIRDIFDYRHIVVVDNLQGKKKK